MASANKATVARKTVHGEESLTLQNQEIDTPVLPVEQMERLHQFRPDVIDWILNETKAEAEARRQRMFKIDRYIFLEKLTGQIFGLIICFAGIAGGLAAIFNGAPGAGATIATVSIGTLAVAYIRRKSE